MNPAVTLASALPSGILRVRAMNGAIADLDAIVIGSGAGGAAAAYALDSVVDARGRVHGIDALYVADGSVLPRSSRANPARSIHAWGLRAGQLLAEALRQEVSA
jgi:choline dehydrogenase-like flavoprotein